MRRAFLLGLLLLPGCAFIQTLGPQPAGQRFVVFFQPSQYELEPEASAVVNHAAAYALANPTKPVLVVGFADPNGSAEASADVSSLRAQNVVKGLVAAGVSQTAIKRRSFGAVPYTFDSQEGRRVEISVGDI